jgi:hypothetical protein
MAPVSAAATPFLRPNGPALLLPYEEPMRGIFVIYLFVIAAGITFYLVVGLAHW